MHDLAILVFAVLAGLTLSGIVANIYRLAGRKPTGGAATIFYYGIMIFAGPSVLVENATRSFRAKDCSGVAYGFAIVIASYWAFALGLMLLSLRLAL